MPKRYVPLRPNDTATGATPKGPVASDRTLTKRRRVGVSIACDACRRRKVRCDGLRPICSGCQASTSQCYYSCRQLAKQGSEQSIIEVIRLLNTLPGAEVMQVLDVLKGETNAATVLSVLRGDLRAGAAASVPAGTFELAELGGRNPIAFPILASTSQLLRSSEYSRLTLSKGGTSAFPINTLPAQQSLLWLHGDRPSASQNWATTTHTNASRPAERDCMTSLDQLCDQRLRRLDIKFWTKVGISNHLASRIISLYLQTDHPLLGHFDPDLFVSDLVTKKHDFCSSVLVNALLYWASQMYTSLNPQIGILANEFCREAETLWQTERENDTILNIAAAQFLSLAYLGQGKDHVMLTYLAQASSMGVRLKLFGVEQSSTSEQEGFGKLNASTRSAHIHTAWGLFNWIILTSLFYHQPGIDCPRYPPRLPIPGDEGSCVHSSLHGPADPRMSPTWPEYMGKTLPYLCKFWLIMHEVVFVYYKDSSTPLREKVVLSFAEHKFRELLAWSNSLPSSLARHNSSAHHVIVLHLWFHSAVLDIFRPCIVNRRSHPKRHLPTFSRLGSTPDVIYAASVAQLKHLIVNYRMNYQSSAYTILWHTALTYVANAVLQNTDEEDWFLYLLLCLYGYEGLSRSWRVAEAISQGLLSMAMRDGVMLSCTGRRILQELQKLSPSNSILGEIRATFMVDLDLAMSNMALATVETLADRFEENASFKEFTTLLDNPEREEAVEIGHDTAEAQASRWEQNIGYHKPTVQP